MKTTLLALSLLILVSINLAAQDAAAKYLKKTDKQLNKISEMLSELKENIIEAQNAADAADAAMYCNDIHYSSEDLHYQFGYLRDDLFELNKELQSSGSEISFSLALSKCLLFQPYLEDIFAWSGSVNENTEFNRLQTVLSSIRNRFEEMMIVFKGLEKSYQDPGAKLNNGK